jgi:hypothetical protein
LVQGFGTDRQTYVTHSRIHTEIHLSYTYIRAACMHAYRETRTYVHACIHTERHVRTYMHAYIQRYTYVRTCMHTYRDTSVRHLKTGQYVSEIETGASDECLWVLY